MVRTQGERAGSLGPATRIPGEKSSRRVQGVTAAGCPTLFGIDGNRRELVVTLDPSYVSVVVPVHPTASVMSEESSLSVGRAFGRWVLYVLVFIVAGGIAAGGSALAYEAVSQGQNPVILYAVIFAASGLIAYRLTKRVLNDA